MAPEQARGVRDLSPAADIFSLGCILYECLTGVPPFVADHVAAVLVRVLFDEPVPVEQQRPGLPSALTDLLARMLRKEPVQRIADAAALRDALASLGGVQEPEPALTLAGPQPTQPTFAEHDQSLLSVVLAAAPEGDVATDATLRPTDLLPPDERQDLIRALSVLGVAADYLANGSLVVTIPSIGSATDQAAVSARAALLIRNRWPAAAVSIATGRGTIRGRTAVGEVVDLASRSLKTAAWSQGARAASGVFMDPLSAQLLAGRFTQTPLPGGTVLLSEQAPADDGRRLLGRPTPCVGREAELGILDAQLHGCIEEAECRVILLTAPPGVGKSRLRHEFLRRIQLRGTPVKLMEGRGELMSAGAAYGILGQLVRRLCGILDGEPLANKQTRLRARIAEYVPADEQERCSLFLGELCGVPFPDAGQAMLIAARQNARILRDQMRQAFLDWMRAECGAGPVLLLLDDLQWADALSISLLDDVLRELRAAPLLLLALARPELYDTFQGIWQAHRPQNLPLKGLSKKAGEQLVLHVLGRQVDPQESARLVERSGGNALFLEELIRSAAEGKNEDHPATVLAMLQARIGRFEPAARRALLAASVYGQTFWAGGLASILGCGVTEEEIGRWLSVLTEQEVIEPQRTSQLAGQREFQFRHLLVREAAYSLLAEADKALGHRMAATFLISAGETQALPIAEHFELGGDGASAARWYTRAAEGALERFAYSDALTWTERATACARTAGNEPDLVAQLNGIESSACMFLGQMARAFACGSQALRTLRPGSSMWCRSMEAMVLGAALGTAEMKQQMPALAGQLIQTDPEPEAEGVYAAALSFLTSGTAIAAPLPQVQFVCARLRTVAERAAAHNPTILRFYGWAYGHFQHHRIPTPWTILREAEATAALCRQAGDWRMLAFVLLSEVALTWAELGSVERAQRAVEEAHQAAQRTQDAVARGLSRVFQEILHIESKPLADVPAAVVAMQQVMQAMGDSSLFAVSALEVQARGYLRLGQYREAEAAARQAAAVGQLIPAYEPTWRATLIRILLIQGKREEALQEAEQALQILGSLGGLGNAEVELRLTISEALHALGLPERARTELLACLHQVQLRMKDIPDPVWTQSYLSRNPSVSRAKQRASEWGLELPSSGASA